MPVYAVRDPVTIRGDLTVHGNMITVRSRTSFAPLDHRGLVSLSDVIGVEPIYRGNLVLDGSLILLALPGDRPFRFAVTGCIKAMGEVCLD